MGASLSSGSTFRCPLGALPAGAVEGDAISGVPLSPPLTQQSVGCRYIGETVAEKESRLVESHAFLLPNCFF